ncbi:phosphatase PAP2 family protein [Acetobacterium tundrae]|nr:phosphatase PAP2 family protein [Acetobacterium tundrae]
MGNNQDKVVKDQGLKPTEEGPLPELEIDGRWQKIITRIRHIPPVYWLTLVAIFFVLFLIFVPNYIWIILLGVVKTQSTLIILVLIFGLTTISLVWSVGQRVDVWVFTYFNMHGRRKCWLDWLMLFFTQLGNGIFAIIVAFFLYFSGYNFLGYAFALGTLSLWLVVTLIKVLIHRTRPYKKIENSRIVGSQARGSSFPSGHTSQSFYMATFLLHYFHANLFIWLAVYLMAFFVGITRIYVGMHYPRDVLGGAMLGTAWGLLGVILNNSF